MKNSAKMAALLAFGLYGATQAGNLFPTNDFETSTRKSPIKIRRCGECFHGTKKHCPIKRISIKPTTPACRNFK